MGHAVEISGYRNTYRAKENLEKWMFRITERGFFEHKEAFKESFKTLYINKLEIKEIEVEFEEHLVEYEDL